MKSYKKVLIASNHVNMYIFEKYFGIKYYPQKNS